MMKLQSWLLAGGIFIVSASTHANDLTRQCEIISALTGDYYAQRLAGKSKQDLQQNTPPEFVDGEFFRTIDLAINLAFSFNDNRTEDSVEETVYHSCIKYQR
mgnify:CR=1 FL=1